MKRITTGLFFPNSIRMYEKDTFKYPFFVCLFFIILLAIPGLIDIFYNPLLSHDSKNVIESAFVSNETIPYTFNNGVLVYNDSTKDELNQYVINDVNVGMTYIFTTQDEVVLNNNMLNNRIIFYKDHLDVKIMVYSIKSINYSDYEKLNGLNLADARHFNNFDFWNKVFDIADEMIQPYKSIIYIFDVMYVLLSSIICVVGASLLITLFNRFGILRKYDFTTCWKLIIYCCSPLFFGVLLSNLFNLAIFNYVGLVITLVYGFILNKPKFKEE